MKLRKKDQKELISVLAQLQRGQQYILRKDVHVCVESRSDTGAHTSRDGKHIVSIDKYIGSDLTLLYTGILRLQKLIEMSMGESLPTIQE